MVRNPRLLLYIAIILAALNLFKTEDAAPRLPLVKADWKRCIIDHHDEEPLGPGPSPTNNYPRRMDQA